MSNTLIDLEGLKAFYTKILTEDLAEYARYDSLRPSAIVAPTLVGGRVSITITNNDSRPLTFFFVLEESIDKDDQDSFDGSTRIDAGVTETFTTIHSGIHYVKAYADDGTQSPVYTVTVTTSGGVHGGGGN